MKLYKYLAPERVDVLQQCLIRYTQPAAFNDPFEIKPVFSTIMEQDELAHFLDNWIPQKAQEIYEQLPQQARSLISPDKIQQVLSKRRIEWEADKVGTEQMELIAPTVRNAIVEELNKVLGILSLTEKPDNLLMWAHYASNHEGFVIGFNSEHPHFNERRGPKDECRHLRKVEYRDIRPQMPMVKFSGADVLLVKSNHWAYEQEWRIFREFLEAETMIPTVPYPVHLFRFSPAAVVEVILGYRMTEKDQKAVINTVKNSKQFRQVHLQQAWPDEMEFRVRFKTVAI